MTRQAPVYEISGRKAILLVLLVTALLGLNVALVVQNRSLKASAGGSRSITLAAGKVLPPLTGKDTQGRDLTFDYGKDPRKTLLLVFSPRCGYCTDNMPNWRAAAQNVDANAFRVVAVSTLPEGAGEYVSKHGLTGVPVVAEPDPKNRVAYEMNLTPQTVLLDAGGRVERVWTGLLQGEERAEVERTLGVKLPPPGRE